MSRKSCRNALRARNGAITEGICQQKSSRPRSAARATSASATGSSALHQARAWSVDANRSGWVPGRAVLAGAASPPG
ncbi:MAG TPA: hypothetical protein VH478_06050 [Trebonia sp.]|nr:hypothetical protein [Trebonia sp.]